MSCFSSLFGRKNTHGNITFELQRPKPRYVNTTNKPSSSPYPRQKPGSSRADARPRLNHTKTGFVGTSAPVRPDSPMPQWGQLVPPRRKQVPRDYYPPRTEETRRTAHPRQQQRHPKPTAPAFPPTVNTSRRGAALGVGSNSSRHGRRQPQQPQQQSGRRGPHSPTNAASVRLANPPKGRGKNTKAKDTPWDSACDVSRPSSGSGRGSSRGNSDGISWADPPVSIPLRQHTLLDDEQDDLYLDAAAAALGRKLYRYPNTKDGRVERAVVRESFFLASEQLRARAERQLQRQELRRGQQQEQQQKKKQQLRQKHQREHESLLRHAEEENVAVAAAAASPREAETGHEANMEAAAVALGRILESTKDSPIPVPAQPPTAANEQAAAAALDRILESTKYSKALVRVGGARSVSSAQSSTTASGQRSRSSISSMSNGGEFARRPTVESHVTREMELLMAHVNQEMEDHEREVRAGTYATHRARGGRR
ncbi:hypothetical protein LMH87_009647 [Akanthomyces muscarius]|uniref:Uncharacterized protein n=1 Tax=Akanthomyces muscarius TaxID=2231603 RepID=A0A9W8UJR4_AKAMU|nr:hypothetical protein LMH87_009647 [Akanthomyces muscarius]KAJ4153144.1 hypothetical protein LMH87_009647 [Akanthomyces muscarius]